MGNDSPEVKKNHTIPGPAQSLTSSIVHSLENPNVKLIEPAVPPIPTYTKNDVTSVSYNSTGTIGTMNDVTSVSYNSTGTIGTMNAQKYVSVVRNYGLTDSIPATIVYVEDNGSAGRWGGTLKRVSVSQQSNYITATFAGTVTKDSN
ncbi:hypothetical protein [Paenibacillus sp. Z6-24]